MANEIFRKKSLERIKSPENLNDYIRVANPGVWLVLVGVIALLVGACIWGIYGRMESTLPVSAVVTNSEAICTPESGDLKAAEPGMTVRIGDVEGIVTEISADGTSATVQIGIADGEYRAEIILESLKPLSFVFN